MFIIVCYSIPTIPLTKKLSIKYILASEIDGVVLIVNF